MSGVMRPVGPESQETYWVRRALVVGIMLALLIIVLVFLINLGGSPGQAAPPVTTASPSTASPSTTSSPVASANKTGSGASPSAASPSASATRTSATASPTAGQKSPSPTTSGKAKNTTAKPKPGPTKAASSAAKKPEPSASARTKKDDEASSKTDSKSESSPAKPATPAVCEPAKLKAGIKSDGHQVRIGGTVEFRLTMTNRSAQSCAFDLSSDNYELKVYSGTDRIWSTDDCARLVPDRQQTLKAGQTADWKISWNGKRSQHGGSCTNRPELPQSGYYYATSQLKGAKPVQYLLILK